ncbi:MAG: hypothetical protein Q8N03_00740 [Ignavibacteria bacterium]|nr:hypothetical protein [Ignavibacteria bacterium]
MKILTDLFNNNIRFTEERYKHMKEFHPEMVGQLNKIKLTLKLPIVIIRSKSDSSVFLYYRFFENTLVGDKFLCVVVKLINNDYFILTSYFTDTVKKGEALWQKNK